MKLQKFRVTNFRSVIDSGWVNCDEVTTLVGINESGKSNILLALWKLNPASGGAIDYLHDLPVTKLSDLRHKKKQTYFIEAVFTLNTSAYDINDELGTDLSPETEISVKRNYEGSYLVNFPNEKTRKAIDDLQKPAETADDAETESVLSFDDITKTFVTYLPTFVYYSNYGNLTSRIYLPNAIKWLKGEKVTGVDLKEDQVRTIRVLFDYVNLQPKEILELGYDATELAQRRSSEATPTPDEIKKAQEDKEQRALLLQSAGTKLTKEFREWWKQGEYKFRFSADGEYFYIWVSDDKRPEEVDLSLRSTGLQWFLSFYLVFLMECRGEHKDSVLLLDEAGLTLHPLAQKDLSAFFNKLSENNQIINTTHSPFIIDPENIDRCRVVYTDENGGTVVSDDLRKGSGAIGEKSIYAVHVALGLTVSDVMLQGSRVVIVEGVSDQFYLSAIKGVLIREKRIAPQNEIVFAPSGGVRGVQGISGLISSKSDDLPIVVLDSDKSGHDFKNKLLKNLYNGSEDRVLSVQDFTDIENSEIEDLIPFDIISRSVDRLLGVQDEDDEFEPEEGKALVPQIEKYAMEHNIELKKGWKVDLARAFKKAIFGKKKKKVPDEYLDMWTKMFQKLI